MSERDKQIEKERKDVVELLLKKNGLTHRKIMAYSKARNVYK